MIDQWILGQQIGLAAYCLRAFSAVGEGAAKEMWDEAFVRLPGLLSEWNWNNDDRMQALPTSTLQLLTALDNRHLDEPFDRGRLQRRAHAALVSLMPERDAPLAKARAIAHHIMHGTGSATRITRFGASLFGKGGGWQAVESANSLEQFAGVLNRLRSNPRTTDQRIDDLDTLLRMIAHTPASGQIATILYAHLFCWPLFVFPSREGELGIALPLAVDVDLAERDSASRHQVVARGDSAFNINFKGRNGKKWYDHLHHARYAGRLLWLRAHGHTGSVFRQQVMGHQAAYDFRWASQIAAGAIGANEQRRLPLVGGSAAPYLSQVILARLLGKTWFLSSVVSGLIGERVVDEETQEEDRDFWLATPGGIKAKVRHFFDTRAFERIVLPNDNTVTQIVSDVRAQARISPIDREGATFADDAEVLFASKLSSVADIVQVEGWRKTAFVRCPEVAWHLYGDNAPGPQPATDLAIVKVLESLASNTNCVLSLQDVSPTAVASALIRINQRIHLDNQPNSPPGLSWCVVRAIREEQDSKFWRMLWRLVGAPLTEYELFRASPTEAIATNRLADALNRFAPTDMRPSHRAPDVIVLVGTEMFAEGMKRNKAPLARPLAIQPLLSRLAKDNSLRISQERERPGVSSYIGPVRIVLLTESDSVGDEVQLSSLSEQEHRALEVLATFRFGFSQYMAAPLLSERGISVSDVRELLFRLVERGALRRAMGQFHIPKPIKMRLELSHPSDIRDQARRHAAAGIGLAPYSVTAPLPALAFDAAFLPENVVEAEMHLVTAYDLYGKLRNYHEQNVMRTGLQRLCRFATLPDWGTVDRLNRSKLGRDAYELACELMENWRTHPDNTEGLPPHPIHYAETIESLMNWEPPRSHCEKIDRLYAEGLLACDRYKGAEEIFNRMNLLGTMSMYLYRYWPELQERLDTVDAQLLALESHWEHLSGRGDWFERVGDNETSNAIAATRYAAGARYAPAYCQNWIKCLGATELAKLDTDEIRSAMVSLTEQQAMNMWRWAAKAYQKDSRTNNSETHDAQARRERVTRRWEAAFLILDNLWSKFPQCRASATQSI